MIKITILAIGKIKEPYITAAIEEYRKRLSPHARLEFIELPEEKTTDDPSESQRQTAVKEEGKRLLKRIPAGACAFLLDLHGKEVSSEELAAKLAKLQTAGHSHFCFIIGGPFGVSDELRAVSDCLSFSRLTFTHQMIRMLLTEQLYRACKINRGEKYHW